MPLSNAEKQARWREKHIARRRSAARIATLLMRQNWPEGHVEEIAAELKGLLSTTSIADLGRALKPVSSKEMQANASAIERGWREQWLQEHPSKTATDFRRLRRAELDEWKLASNQALLAAEKTDWEHDHLGQQYPEHLCGLSDRESTDYARWQRQRARRRT